MLCLVHIFTVPCSLFSTLIMVLLIRTFTQTPLAFTTSPCNTSEVTIIALDQPRLDRFRQALRYKTVSQEGGLVNAEELLNIQEFIKRSYPTIHKSPLVKLDVVQNFSLLYTIQGSNASLTPFLLMGHLDVVPESPGEWDAKPFSGDVVGDFIYGRGALDMKQSVFGILEALEFLLHSGHEPQRPFYVAFGHDEEVMGLQGAAHVGRLLGERGVKLEFILDEGLVVSRNIVPGMRGNTAALIGIAEKGFVTLRLTVNLPGGHSSMPDRESAIGVLAGAVARLEANPQPVMFGRGPEIDMLEHLAPHMDFIHRVLMANLWLFGPIISRVLAGKPSTSATVRTTTAITQFNAGIKENVIAPTATATVNHRIHPAQTLDEVLAHDHSVINDDRVHIEVVTSRPASQQSSHADDSFGYQTIKTSIQQIWRDENVVVAPGLLVGFTDTQHYAHLTSNIYRFSPTVMGPEDVARFHGLNERISVKNYEQAINFFYHVMLNADC